ncbi:MAG TPA: aminotransferase class V-fold PLP-dependent enzyme [Vicinamibacteria bacterium]|nr:aminotransferase class V-fold PLP-dependent enzyme [Vicinamibacteria bacterium]
MRELLQDAARRAASFLEELPTRSVEPSRDAIAGLQKLRVPLPEGPLSPEKVLALLDEIGSPATVATAGPRYFGFVTGGSLPASVAANWLSGAWDQNAAFLVGSPIAAALEEISLSWIRELLALPSHWGGGFVTGTTMGNFSGLVAARHHVLSRAGWDVERNGLFGAPEVRVVVGAEVHASLLKALALLGFGRARVTTLPVDGQGRMRADALEKRVLEGPTVVCLQAGNVNTGAFDPIAEIASRAREAGAWVHLDGAFGLWAAVSPRTRHFTEGLENVDSIATDLHKWLNVPYDNGLALYQDSNVARAALAMTAAYLPQTDERTPSDFTPEASRRARGIDIWAALLSLGREGLVDLVDRCCRYARKFAADLEAAGCQILNEVQLNQVLVAFGDDERTKAVIQAVQRDGTCWCGGTFWQGKAAMRISVSSWATTEEDVERSVAAIVRVAKSLR